MTLDRTTPPPPMPSDTAAYVEAARIAVAEAIERDRAILRIKKKYDAKSASKASPKRPKPTAKKAAVKPSLKRKAKPRTATRRAR